MKISGSLDCIFVGMALILFWVVGTAHAEMASVYGGRDGYCGSRTAKGGASKLLSNLGKLNQSPD